MGDKFFSQTTCDRCGGPLNGVRTMSMFTTECICMKCKEQERQRDDYKEAQEAERAALKRGDWNYAGIGW